MAQKRAYSSSSQPQPEEIYTSNPIHDRASTFLALFSPSVALKTLQSSQRVATAEHKIAAWRLPSRQMTLAGPPKFDVGHDDDGEKGAGIRLGRVLEALGVTGSVVVGRWWGGVMLGPVRFTWIEECAKEAIGLWRSSTEEADIDGGGKRVKIDMPVAKPVQDGRTKEILISELQARDGSITVLRDLLRKKKDKLEGVTSPSASPAKVQEYGSMSISRLLALDKARDATLAYILKQLDEVDKQQKEEDELDAAFEQVAEAEEKRKDEAAIKEMLATEQEEDDEAFDEMERIAKEIEEESKMKELESNSTGTKTKSMDPVTPERPK